MAAPSFHPRRTYELDAQTVRLADAGARPAMRRDELGPRECEEALADRSMNTEKPTKGPWRVWYTDFSIGVQSIAAEHIDSDGDPTDICAMDNADYFGAAALHANADLIAEAGTVYHETGLSPRELLKQRDALEKALRESRSFVERHSEPWYTSGQSLLVEIDAALPQSRKEGEAS